jgi:hypothetical protein
MVRLTRKGFHRAEAFIHKNARSLEQRRFMYEFQGGTAEGVLAELARYQNSDGGFGNALEPDLRLADSSVYATSVGLQTVRELSVPIEHPLVQGAIQYLLDNFDPEYNAWPIIPSNANDAPHAPWWRFDQDLADRWGGFLANPRAEILGYLYDYADLVPGDFLTRLSRSVVAHLETLPDDIERHDLACYLRLSETHALPEEAQAAMLPKLTRAVDHAVAKDPLKWREYYLKPLDVVRSPDAPFAGMFAQEIALNLDFEIQNQEEEGCWAPSWTWGDEFPQAWETAEREWQGIITLGTLKLLRNFDRLEPV